ncbi:phosphoenolpyruvate-dependent sugar phosphotransferase system, EIIA 1 [Bifidobacterium bifidum ATCC 29521 = JCM 1255 = DSM 20456]|nr:phosphoenolpyruvate-dependent sugar phosphotransferase system, EIIA 1 [Bifidobacterium bifidum ATCC 29521 = JCM 1255 = DSM 20456]
MKAADNAVLAPVDGAIKPITEVPDETFAAKILGDGFAVVPTSGRVVAPVAGKITTVAQAKHAVGITTPRRSGSARAHRRGYCTARRIPVHDDGQRRPAGERRRRAGRRGLECGQVRWKAHRRDRRVHQPGQDR